MNTGRTHFKVGHSVNLGKSHSEETKRKIGRAHRGKKLSEEHINKLRKSHTGHVASEETRKKMRANSILFDYAKRLPHLVGEKSTNWKGGITLLDRQIRTCLKYRQWRSDIFTRDDFTCQWCGVRGGVLHVHHIKPFSCIIKDNNVKMFEEALECDELWNINNGVTLCYTCHNSTRGVAKDEL